MSAQYVYAFQFADVNSDDNGPGPERHLVAKDLSEATERAKQFLVDDGLRGEFYEQEGIDYQITGVRRLMRLDWPVEGE